MVRYKKTISQPGKFTAFIFMLILFANHVLSQDKKICEIEMGNILDPEQKDSIYCNEIWINTRDTTIFSWGESARLISIDSTNKRIDCLISESILAEKDTLIYRLVTVATVYVNTNLCQIKKNIHASELLSKPAKQITAEYAQNLKHYKNKRRINPAYSNENYLVRYCIDLAYAALTGDSLAVELLLKIHKDFELFKEGLDAEDLYYHREMLHDLLIVDKPQAYQERYLYLWRIRN